MSLTPLEWFTNKQVNILLKYYKRIDTLLLSRFGWQESWIYEGLEKGNGTPLSQRYLGYMFLYMKWMEAVYT